MLPWAQVSSESRLGSTLGGQSPVETHMVQAYQKLGPPTPPTKRTAKWGFLRPGTGVLAQLSAGRSGVRAEGGAGLTAATGPHGLQDQHRTWRPSGRVYSWHFLDPEHY